MFGCYRRNDAANPETYAAAVAMVLEHYPRSVIEAVTDPHNGLPSRKSKEGWSGLPDVAEVKQACEAEAVRQDRMREWARAPRVDFSNRRRELPPEGPGARANLFVPSTNQYFAALCAKAAKVDSVWWRYDDERPGIWIPLDWWDVAGKRPAP